MVKEATGRVIIRYDKGGKYRRYFVYLPKNLVENSAFSFKIDSPMPVKITFNKKRIIIEKIEKT